MRVLRHPMTLVMVIGLVIRFVLMPTLTYAYDISFWATSLQNIMGGDGLYDLPGYYYSPVWGYIIGAAGAAGNMLFGVDTFGVFFDELLPGLQDFMDSYTSTSMITTIEFNVLMKVPLIIADVIVAFLLYYLIMEKTEDTKKAAFGSALWFLCPIVIYSSSVHATFDVFSVLFMVLAVLLLRKEQYLWAGAMLAAAVFTKLFPAFLLFVFVGYIAARYKGDRNLIIRNVLLGVMGVLCMMVILYIPMILEGTFIDSFWFLIGRLDSAGSAVGIETSGDLISSYGMLIVTLVQPLIMIAVVYLSYRLYTKGDPELDDRLLWTVMMTTVLSMAWVPSPQYLLIIVPFLAYHIAVRNRRYIVPWAVMSVAATLFAISTSNFSVFLSLGAFTDIMDLNTIVSLMEWMQYTTVLGMSVQNLMFTVMGVAEGIGIWLILLYVYLDHRRPKGGVAVE